MISELTTAIEAELQRQVARLDQPRTHLFHEMLTYHMGWTGDGAGPEATGKRIRPLLVLLAYGSAAPESPMSAALPAAAAVELVHNFSLVHDDIQDNSPKRRGRPAVWKVWDIPLAINAGDALFVLAGQAIMDLAAFHPASIVVAASTLLQSTCLDLTRGQYLDMAFEGRTDLAVEDYWAMIEGKTAALLSTSCRLGALLGGAENGRQELYAAFGRNLGLAFQIQDDILGIWGDEASTGKSAASDLVEGKNSLPILFGLSQDGQFAARWREGNIQLEEVRVLAQLLATEGAFDYAQERARYWNMQAIDALAEAHPQGVAGKKLIELANSLLGRRQ